MPKCYGCKNKGTHRWGQYWLCDTCHEEAMITHKAKNETVNIRILEESEFGLGGGCYDWETGAIYLSNSGMEFSLELILHHEIMHHVLNTCIDPPTSYNWDNISPNGEVDKFAVCDEV